MAGILKRDTPDPEGGCVDRDDNGEPTGILRENAKYLINDILPETTREAEISARVELSRILCWRRVSPTVTDMGLLDNNDGYLLYSGRQARLCAEESASICGTSSKDDRLLPFRQNVFKGINRSVAGLEADGDSSVSGRTAWMNELYLWGDDNAAFLACVDEEDRQCDPALSKKPLPAFHSFYGWTRPSTGLLAVFTESENWLGGDVPYLS